MVRSVLIYVGLDLIGDGLMKLPFVRAVRHAFPEARITWCAGRGKTVYGASLAPVVAGLIDEVIEDIGLGDDWRQLFGRRPLGGRHFDVILDTQRRVLPSLILRRVHHGLFISAAAGWLLSDRGPRNRRKLPGMVAQMMKLLEAACGRPISADAPITIPFAMVEQAEQLLPDGPAYVGLSPGAGGRHKCWPLKDYIALAEMLMRQGQAPVFLLGPAEAEWADEIKAALPGVSVPLGLNPLETIAVGRRLAVAVANDSGIGHMLAAADVPMVSLFGPTSAEKFAPAVARLTVVKSQDFGGDDMVLIPKEAVLTAVNSFLSLQF